MSAIEDVVPLDLPHLVERLSRIDVLLLKLEENGMRPSDIARYLGKRLGPAPKRTRFSAAPITSQRMIRPEHAFEPNRRDATQRVVARLAALHWLARVELARQECEAVCRT